MDTFRVLRLRGTATDYIAAYGDKEQSRASVFSYEHERECEAYKLARAASFAFHFFFPGGLVVIG
jgi:hypothetical protein